MIKINEKGSITLFTLIAMMFFLTIAFTAYASAMAKLQAQNEDLERIKASYEQDLTEEGLRELYNKLTGTREWLPSEGTEQNPYKIYTIEDLLELSNKTNNGNNFSGKYIELMNDLDFNNVKSYEKANRTDFGDVNNNGTIEELRKELTTGEGWQAIGTDSKRFKGDFNGNNYTISNLYLNKAENYIGLFGYIDNATVKNLKIKNANIQNSKNYVGIIGNTYKSNINNISNYNGYIEGEMYTGGICGFLNSSNIKKCLNESNVKSNNTGGYVGGIIGCETGSFSIVRNCYNLGEIKGYSVGGIVGRATQNTESSKVEITSCYNLGVLNATNTKGGIINKKTVNNSASIIVLQNNFWLNTCGATYGWAGATTDIGAIPKTSAEMKSQEFVNLLNADQEDDPWTMDTSSINNGYPILKWQLDK